MSLFHVDRDRCKQDGICAVECPVGIIQFKNRSSYPEPSEHADELCIHCGHCVAVCPHGAFSHKDMAADQCPPVRKDMLLNPEQVEHFLRSRRSIRHYHDRPVDQETLARLLDIAHYAPSGHNSQPVKWLVIHDKDDVQAVAGHVVDWMKKVIRKNPAAARQMHFDRTVSRFEEGKDVICRKAPHLIMAYGLKSEATAPVACTIGLSYLELAAPSFQLGACWAGYVEVVAVRWAPLQEFLNLPKGHICMGALMVGYPKHGYHRLPLRNDIDLTWR